jgi:ribosomal protein S18 acetylase RimI-like enzyme
VGKKLLEYGLTQLRQSGMRLALVVTGLNEGHTPARRMYEKAGFQPLCQTVTYSMDMRNWQPT